VATPTGSQVLHILSLINALAVDPGDWIRSGAGLPAG
jgi:hypothetical protein